MMHRVTYTRDGEFMTEFASNETLQLRQFLMWLEREHIPYSIFEGHLHVATTGILTTIWKEKHEQEELA